MPEFQQNNQTHQSDIINIADNLDNCKRIGIDFRANCPICHSKSSRPFVLFGNGIYYCHSCNATGTVWKLAKDIFNIKLSNFKSSFKNVFNNFTNNEKPIPNLKSKRDEYLRPIITHSDRIDELLYQLIPKNTKDLDLKKLTRFIGYDHQNDTLAINLIDEDGNIRNIKRRQVRDIKWMGAKGSDGKFAPSRLTGQKFVFIASGIAEFLILEASELDYIVMQSDGMDINHLLPREVTAVIIEDNDKREIKIKEDEEFRCFMNPLQFNPFQKKVTKKVSGQKLAINFEKILNQELKAGYDLRDFITEYPENWKNLIDTEIEKILNQPQPVEDEIVIDYKGQYPKYLDRFPSVVVSRTNSGKTFKYEKKAGNLILVPKDSQANLHAGTKTQILLDKINDDGAIITFHKFYGHYVNSPRFKELIDEKKIKLIVDEAHELVLNPSPEFQLIYKLDAIFLSATLEKFFRPDLQRYKYKPENPDILYYTTNGKLPANYRSIIFMDNTKVLKQNYPDNAILGKAHNFPNQDIKTTKKDIIFTTSVLREGVSVKNKNFNACMVYAQECRMWNNKNTIQALYRLRTTDSLKIVSAPPKAEYTKFLDYKWWKNRVNELTNDKTTNTIMGEYYSRLIEITHKVNQYEKADEYSLVCFLSELTKNNYDKDFYEFREYQEEFEALEINTVTDKLKVSNEDEEFLTYIFEDGEEWSIPKNKQKAFKKWLMHKENGLIDKIEKLNEFKNFHEIYTKSNVAKIIKASYNEMHKRTGKRYNIELFYKLLRSLVKIEIRDDKTGKILKRVSKDKLKSISIKVISNCAISGIKIINKVVKEVVEVLNETKKWLDSSKEKGLSTIDGCVDSLNNLRAKISESSSYCNLNIQVVYDEIQEFSNSLESVIFFPNLALDNQ